MLAWDTRLSLGVKMYRYWADLVRRSVDGEIKGI